ncbi:MAG: DNA gyrase C-terminal beta-propeller domain-containing protein, partial [Steroidobacteraceae bacterium]
VQAGDELMLISSTGTLVRTPVADISVVGRNTQGVRLIRLGEAKRLTGVERVAGLEGGDDAGALEAAGSDDGSEGQVGEEPDAGGDDLSPL